MHNKEQKSKLVYFADAFPANKMLKKILDKLREDKLEIFIVAFIDDDDTVEYCWFSKVPSYRALGLVTRMQHKINRFLDDCELSPYEEEDYD